MLQSEDQVSPQGVISYLLLFSHSNGAERAPRPRTATLLAPRFLPIRHAAAVSLASALILVGGWVATSTVCGAVGAELPSQTDFCPPLVRLEAQTLTRDSKRSTRRSRQVSIGVGRACCLACRCRALGFRRQLLLFLFLEGTYVEPSRLESSHVHAASMNVI